MIGRFISADPFILSIMNPQSLNRYTYCLNNPLKYIDPTGFWGESLEDPWGEGALGWTSEEGWLIGVGGEWFPVDDESVDTMISDFKESLEQGEADTWTEFTKEYGLPMASKEIPSYMWGGNPAGNNNYIWIPRHDYNREKDIMEPRLTLVEYPSLNINWQRFGEQALGLALVGGGTVVASVGVCIPLAALSTPPVEPFAIAAAPYIIALGLGLIDLGNQIYTGINISQISPVLW